MPIYEFHCNGCGKDFEELVLSRSEKITCPACGEPDCQKLMSAASFVSRGADGSTVSASAGGGGCSGCAATNCATCGC
ncbi:MAG: zinc ribbon domain-containing protein [Candidatus Adiutrix sp.]|jgi:putative FmdB family regulatory protein|nr:zinc ribbon domain-containing protein [Candidatus Adiutrix sp.]